MQHNYKDLKVWQRAHEVVIAAYKATKDFPSEEKYGLSSQIRRAAVSTAANIVEGSKKASAKEFSHYLNISQGSAAELEYLLLVAKEVGVLSDQNHKNTNDINDEVCRMLYSFRSKIESET